MPRLKKLAWGVRVEGLEELRRELGRRGLDVRAGVEAVCEAGAAVVGEELARRGPGRVGESIVRETTGKAASRVTVSVGPDRRTAAVGRWLEFGTKPHAIPFVRNGRGRRGRRLKVLKIGGRYVRRVMHPGARARPFMRPGLAASRGEATAAMGAEMKRVVGA